MQPSLSVLLAAALAAPLAAQQAVGLYISRGISTISGVLCGFNCGSATNTGTATASVGQVISIRAIGDAGLPAILLGAVGPAWACPGIPFPGLNNSLLLSPGNVVALSVAVSVTPGARTNCNNASGGLELMLNNYTLPPAAAGLLVTFQCITFDAGVPTFTRPIELTVL